jgi:hypothetical protein
MVGGRRVVRWGKRVMGLEGESVGLSGGVWCLGSESVLFGGRL